VQTVRYALIGGRSQQCNQHLDFKTPGSLRDLPVQRLCHCDKVSALVWQACFVGICVLILYVR
jgi:hypothetical protein